MNEEFYKRVRSAAIAGWWTLLIVAVFMTLNWFAFLAMVRARPEWMLRLWGPDIAWSTIQTVGLWGIAVFKICVWVAAMIVIWLSLWARRLGRQ